MCWGLGSATASGDPDVDALEQPVDEEEHRHGEGRDLALAQAAVMDAVADEGDLFG